MVKSVFLIFKIKNLKCYFVLLCFIRIKSGWLQEHEKLMMESRQSTAEVVLIGDSIVRHFQRYPKILNHCFKPNNILNLGMSGDCTQNILWHIKFGVLPKSTKAIIVHVGTNNVVRDNALNIAAWIIDIANLRHLRNVNAWVVTQGSILFRYWRQNNVNQRSSGRIYT